MKHDPLASASALPHFFLVLLGVVLGWGVAALARGFPTGVGAALRLDEGALWTGQNAWFMVCVWGGGLLPLIRSASSCSPCHPAPCLLCKHRRVRRPRRRPGV
jgi:hypothetical protein